MDKLPRIAICYDFDKTLSPDDMQTYAFIPSIGMTAGVFWQEANQLAESNHMDKNLAWMWLMLEESRDKNQPISKQAFTAQGEKVQFFSGLPEWFERINEYARGRGIEVQHYIISSGLKETIEGTAIAHYIRRVYASGYMYDADGMAVWPVQAVNYTNKTQFIFRIAKGCFDENDEGVNQSMREEELYVPYENMIYIGDSDTDIPCMRVIKTKGGIAIGVYNPESDQRAKVYGLYLENRINYFAAADYGVGKPLFGFVQKTIDMMAAREALKAEAAGLEKLTAPYATYKSMYLTYKAEGKLDDPDVAELLKKRKAQIEGNIDNRDVK